MTSSPRWLMTLTAILPDWGLVNDREVSLRRVSGYISLENFLIALGNHSTNLIAVLWSSYTSSDFFSSE